MRKQWLWLGIVVIMLLFLVGRIVDRPLYGNDDDTIADVIRSIDLYQNRAILLLEVIDFDDDRIVAFLSDDAPSVIQFERDARGHYGHRSSETRRDDDLSQFVLGHIGADEKVIVVSVRNQYATLDEFVFKANEKTYRVRFDEEHPQVQWTVLEDSAEGGYRFDWLYPEE